MEIWVIRACLEQALENLQILVVGPSLLSRIVGRMKEIAVEHALFIGCTEFDLQRGTNQSTSTDAPIMGRAGLEPATDGLSMSSGRGRRGYEGQNPGPD
jgi:hypothetical protein